MSGLHQATDPINQSPGVRSFTACNALSFLKVKMSKQITNKELATIVARLLIKPQSIGQLDSQEKQLRFMSDIAQVVCEHCGGEIHHPASNFTGETIIGIHGNESLPADGGIWKDYDRQGELFSEAGVRDFFAEAFLAKTITVNDPDFVGGVQNIRANRGIVAQEILKRYPMDTKITTELYDLDETFASCLNAMTSLFEFPSWSGRTLAEFWKIHSNSAHTRARNFAVIQYSTYHQNKDGVCAGNITFNDCEAAKPSADGWVLPNGHTLRFRN